MARYWAFLITMQQMSYAFQVRTASCFLHSDFYVVCPSWKYQFVQETKILEDKLTKDLACIEGFEVH